MRFQTQFLRQWTRRLVEAIGPLGIALGMLILRATCRVRLHNDPRPQLRVDDAHYVYSVLHAHQIAAATCREPGTAAMVSQSRDGDYVAMGLRVPASKRSAALAAAAARKKAASQPSAISSNTSAAARPPISPSTARADHAAVSIKASRSYLSGPAPPC